VTYTVSLDVFEGPIDLLLHLITRRRVDIYDVSLAGITDEYLAAMGTAGRLDLESATGFLIVAATLLELKSSRLLPRREEGDVDSQLLEERDRLLARLVECATYRAAGAWMGAGLARGSAFHPRTAGLEPQFAGLMPDVLVSLELDDLARAAGNALAPKPQLQLDVSHLAPIRVSVRDAILDLSGRLEGGGSRSFAALCGEGRERIEVVVRFLALLELFKAGAVELDQPERFGDIVARWTGEVGAEAVIEEADEYAVGPEASG
jgi:segregation and condensation protein A